MRSNRVALFFLSLLINGIPLFAQNTSSSIPLRQILIDLEDRFDISFTYADETIENLSLIPPSDSLGIAETINYLRDNTSLSFYQLDDRFITISKATSVKIDICGYLIDNNDKSVISGATIQVGNHFMVSDSLGYFRAQNISSSNVLLVRMLGYETRQIIINEVFLSENDCNNIFLKPKVRELREVTIQNYITSGITKQINGSFVIDIDDLGILPGLIEPDVLQTIQALPGIQSINETVSHINVRGGTNDQNLVLWDGIKMYQTGHFFGLISAFNPYLNKDVTIIKNGTSAEFNDGVSSIIDIRSDNTPTTKFTGGAGINMINADAFFKIPITKKLTLQLSGRRAITDILKTPVFDNYFERAFGNTDVTKTFPNGSDTTFNSNENFYFYDVGANLIYDITKKDKLRIHFLNIFNELDYQENIVSTAVTESKTSSLTQKSIASSLFYQRLWNNKLSTSAQIYLSNYTLRATNFNVLNNQRLIQENEVLDTGIKLDALWQINHSWDLLAGYQFQEVGIGNLEDINNPEFKRYIKRVIRTHVGFAETSFKSGSGNTNIRFGVRANYFPKFNKLIIEPRLALNQKLFSFLSLEVLGEFKSQSATQIIDLQNDFLGVEKRRWVLADDKDIPIVESKQVSAGLNFTKNKLLISLEGFYKHVEGITSSSQGFQNQFQYAKAIGDYNITGIEVLVNKQFRELSAWASYSFSNNHYDFSTLNPSVFPNNLDITHAATAGIIANIKQFEASAGLNWHTGKPNTLPSGITGDQIEYQSPNSTQLPEYLRIDLSLRYNFNLSEKVKAQIGGSIWNLTNHQNIYNIYYQTDNNGDVQEIQELALGITPNLMFRISF